MSAGGAAGAGAAVAAAIGQAIKASGVFVRVEPFDFAAMIERIEEPLVIHATGGFFGFGINYQYLTPYKGLAFYTKSSLPIDLPADTELIHAKSIFIPA